MGQINNKYFSFSNIIMYSEAFLENRLNDMKKSNIARTIYPDEAVDEKVSCLLDMRKNALKIASWCGAWIEILTNKNFVDFCETYEKQNNAEYKEDLVVVDYNGEYLTVKTPLTFNAEKYSNTRTTLKSKSKKHNDDGWKASRIFKEEVSIALDRWERKNNIKLDYGDKMPYLCLVERRAPKFNFRTMGDNDNMETSNIINIVTRHCLVNDCCTIMDYAGVFRLIPENEEPCMMFYFIPNKYIMEHPEFLQAFFTNKNMENEVSI